MFDKDITVINRYIDKTTRKPKYKLSYIHGFWSSNDGISISGTNLIKADRLSAKILMSESGYQKPKEFQIAQDKLIAEEVNESDTNILNNQTVDRLVAKETGWTLKNNDYLVKGIVNEFTTIQELLENYQEVMKITDIAIKDYGSQDMWHWAIIGE